MILKHLTDEMLCFLRMLLIVTIDVFVRVLTSSAVQDSGKHIPNFDETDSVPALRPRSAT